MAIENDGLKEILTTDVFGLLSPSTTSSLSGNELLYTYANVNDTTRRYAGTLA